MRLQRTKATIVWLPLALAMGLAGCVAPNSSVPAIVVQAPPPVAPTSGPGPGPSVAERLAADQQRINDGLRARQFTQRQYRELQGRHDAIENTRRAQLAAGGGQFAPGQYEQLLQRESALSRSIFEFRHDGATPTAY